MHFHRAIMPIITTTTTTTTTPGPPPFRPSPSTNSLLTRKRSLNPHPLRNQRLILIHLAHATDVEERDKQQRRRVPQPVDPAGMHAEAQRGDRPRERRGDIVGHFDEEEDDG